MNAYVTARIAKMAFNFHWKKWGSDTSKENIIVRDVYGLKSDGVDFHKHLADCMRHVGYNMSPAKPYMWINPKVDIDDDRFYSYILCYGNDILVFITIL